ERGRRRRGDRASRPRFPLLPRALLDVPQRRALRARRGFDATRTVGEREARFVSRSFHLSAPRRGDPRGTERLRGEKGSSVEVERELVRMRSQAHGVDLVLALVLDPRLHDVLGEDVALEEELVVPLEVL